MKAFWQQCEGQIIDGFPLEQYLSGDDSAVFLTHRGLDSSERAAIKLIHSDPGTGERQLRRWRLASELAHPNLLGLYECGHWELNNVPLLYVVMEYADENLAQVLVERPLTAEEAREMIEPALRALAFLHASGYVHGRLKPSNFMAVGNVLKLASDGVREIGAEANPADDVWAFGVTLVETLTQHVNGELPASTPGELRDIARNALQRDPRERWTVAQIQQRLRPPRADRRKQVYAVIAGIAIVLLAMIAGMRLIHEREPTNTASPVQSETKPSPAAPARPQRAESDVIHEVMPEVLARARNSIRGKVMVDVRVEVDDAGNVQRAALESRGPSRYFADAALQAARRWKFAPTESPHAWTVHFEFTRTGTKVSHQRASQ